jgi:hypothetical protein
VTLFAAREILPRHDTPTVGRIRTLIGLLLVLFPCSALRGDAAVTNATCASALVIDPNALPWSSPGIDTTGMPGDANPPVFPCYTKGQLPSGGQAPPSRIVWFSFAPTVSGTYRIDTFGSVSTAAYDTILGVYTGSCGSLDPVSGVCGRNGFFPDDAPGSLQSSVTLILSAGTTYQIAAGGIGQPNGFMGQFDPSPGGTLRLTVTPVAIAYPYTYLVSSVARMGGYTSDLNVTNVEASEGQFLIQYLGHGDDGDRNVPPLQPVSSPQRIGALGSREFVDILSGIFSISSDYGAILVQSTNRLLIGARTATPAPAGVGSFGQFIEAVDVSSGASPGFALAYGETGRFIAMREDASARTNLAFVNTSMSPCAVRSEVLDGSGNLLGDARTFTVPPHTMIQKNRLKDTFGFAADVRDASVLVTNVTMGCAVSGTAYVVDGNTAAGTNDPFAVPLRK